MGLFKAITSSISGVMKDQWKEMFYCESIPNDILLVKGVKRAGANSSNNGNDNVITDGSVVIVADGEAALVVCNGKITDEFIEPGRHEFHSTETEGVFSGKDIKNTTGKIMSDIGTRVSFGGDVPIIYRVYYMNTKEIVGNHIDLQTVSVRIKDDNIGLDMDITVNIDGCYSFKIVDPRVIYTKIIGNVDTKYRKDLLIEQLNSELSSRIYSAVSTISENPLRVSGIPSIAPTIGEAVKEKINPWLRENRGIELYTFPISGIQISTSDMAALSELQKAEVLTDPRMAGATLVAATADAMKAAAANAGYSKPVSSSADTQNGKSE